MMNAPVGRIRGDILFEEEGMDEHPRGRLGDRRRDNCLDTVVVHRQEEHICHSYLSTVERATQPPNDAQKSIRWDKSKDSDEILAW